MLSLAGWAVQDKKKIDFGAGLGVAVREYQTDVGPADYVLFVDKKPVGVVEAKPEDWGQKITTVEEQASAYAAAKLKWVNNREPLPFVYESTGVLTRFTDGRDPKPRSREVFSFPRPGTVQDWRARPASLRERLQGLPVLDPAGLRACQVNAIEKLEASFRDDRPRALIQMATGSGKTYTAISAYPDTMIRLRVTREVVDESFFSYVWNSHVLRRQIEGAARTTAGIYKINQGHILDFIIPLCSPGEQAVVVSQLSENLSAIDEFVAEVDEQVSRLGALRQAILKKAFAGQLVAQDPSDEPASVLLKKIRTERAQAGKGGATSAKARRAKTAA